jgi:hypothetical protein
MAVCLLCRDRGYFSAVFAGMHHRTVAAPSPSRCSQATAASSAHRPRPCHFVGVNSRLSRSAWARAVDS